MNELLKPPWYISLQLDALGLYDIHAPNFPIPGFDVYYDIEMEIIGYDIDVYDIAREITMEINKITNSRESGVDL